MNKAEIQARIEKCESRESYLQREHDALKSEIASLKADLAKCEDGIEEEKCWRRVYPDGETSFAAFSKQEASDYPFYFTRVAYMPECRQVTAEDVAQIPCFIPVQHEKMARELHKLGFRIKVTP